MRMSWTMETNCVASRYLPFQENVDRHHGHREKDLALALLSWKYSWAIVVKVKRRPLLCC